MSRALPHTDIPTLITVLGMHEQLETSCNSSQRNHRRPRSTIQGYLPFLFIYLFCF